MSHSRFITDMLMYDLQRHQELLNPAFRMQRMLEQLRPHLALSDIVSPVLRHSIQQNAISDLLDRLNTFGGIRNIIESNGAIANAVYARIEEQQRSIAALIRPHLDFKIDLPLSISALVDSSAIWESSIGAALTRFDALGLIGVRDDFVDRILSPSRAFSTFMQSASARLEALDHPTHLLAANSAIKVIEGQYASIAQMWQSIPLPVDSEPAADERLLEAPMVQFEAVCAADLDEKTASDPDQLAATIPVLSCAEDARATIALVCRANEVTQAAGKGEMFKPTTRFVEACADLSWLVARDKKSFGDVIDCLYFIFYEGAGKDNLRFLEKNGGPMSADQADFIWCMKHLRNKYARHDPDHGKPAEIAKSWAELQQKWLMLGLTAAPHSEAEFFRAQHVLLRMAREFVESLLRRLTVTDAAQGK